MIANILKYNLLVSLLIWSSQIYGSRPDHEERRVIKKAYETNKSVVLEIDNQFGSIHVESWDKNQIEVEVEIIARGRNEDRAGRILSKIDIDISESSGEISFDTDANNIDTRNGSESFEINYKVKMNPKNPIRFENKFGDIYLPFRIGVSEIELQYGNLKSDGAEGHFLLELAFGNAEIGNLETAEMEVQYGNVSLGEINALEMEQKFSNLELLRVKTLDLESKYGEIDLGEVDVAEVEAHFSAFKLENLLTQLVFEGNYVSGFEIEEIEKGFSLVDLSGQYSSYKLGLEVGLSADIEAEFSYAELNHSGVDVEFYYKDFDGNKKEYRGRINGGNPSKKIIINSSYGNARLTQ
ncbi:MAG: hypothetical protein ABJG41_18955 [Cyclobacteriaceae bacterium]